MPPTVTIQCFYEKYLMWSAEILSIGEKHHEAGHVVATGFTGCQLEEKKVSHANLGCSGEPVLMLCGSELASNSTICGVLVVPRRNSHACALSRSHPQLCELPVLVDLDRDSLDLLLAIP